MPILVGGLVLLWFVSTGSAAPKPRPVNTALPAVSGTTIVGQTLGAAG
jgi:hypothetical protein